MASRIKSMVLQGFHEVFYALEYVRASASDLVLQGFKFRVGFKNLLEEGPQILNPKPLDQAETPDPNSPPPSQK